MKYLTLALMFCAITVFAQDDSIKVVSINTSITLASKNVWRGINYGDNAPSLQGSLAYNFKNAIEIGAYGTVTTNGTKKGYGNWLELYTTFSIDRWSLTFDDYYFFSYDSLNDYLNWNDAKTLPNGDINPHLLEARLRYNIDKKFSIFASYNIWANAIVAKAWYFETEYYVRKDLSFLVGYLSGASWLNFHNGAGVTVLGVAGSRDIKITNNFSIPIKTSLLFNPNYEDIATYDGLGTNPVNFVIALSF